MEIEPMVHVSHVLLLIKFFVTYHLIENIEGREIASFPSLFGGRVILKLAFMWIFSRKSNFRTVNWFY